MTLFSDYAVFYRIGQEFWQGQYSSLCLYPFPMVFFFAVLALFNPAVGLAALTLTSLTIVVFTFKRWALAWIFYVPILNTIAAGQIDLIMFTLWRWSTPLSLALLSLKPQLFILAIPKLMSDRALLKKTALWIGILYGLPTLLYPGWVVQWLGQMNDGRIGSGFNAVLYSVPVAAFMVVAGLTFARRWHWSTVATSFNPFIRAYDYTLLAGVSLWLIPASLATWVMMHALGSAWPVSLLGVMAGVAQAGREELCNRKSLEARRVRRP